MRLVLVQRIEGTTTVDDETIETIDQIQADVIELREKVDQLLWHFRIEDVTEPNTENEDQS